MNRYGIRGHALNLIKSYLIDRKQTVKINETQSSYQTVAAGVPHGTILGPLLFILYINELLLAIPEESIFSNADDMAIISKDKSNWKTVEQNMNN